MNRLFFSPSPCSRKNSLPADSATSMAIQNIIAFVDLSTVTLGTTTDMY